jgi:tetratricopeptide (TPR) repeat protein
VLLGALASPALAEPARAEPAHAEPAVPAELPPERVRWIHLESEHFSIYSSAPERTARELATRLERLRQVLAKLGGEDGLTPPRPTDIFVFRDERAWRPFRPLAPDGKPKELGAYFLSRADRNSIALYDREGGDPIETILHEYLHSLLDASLSRLPVWANEGLADFYSTFTVGEDAAEIGRPLRYAVQVLDGRARMPTRRLLAVTVHDPEYNEWSRQTIFYAQSWLTTHYLLLGRPERHGDFGRYVDALEGGADPLAAFVDAFGLEPEALDEELELARRKRVYPFMSYRFDELAPLADFRVRDVAYPEILARLGDLTRRLGPAERPRGVALLEAARKLDPASPLPAYGLALAKRDEGATAEAVALLRDSLARDAAYEPTQAALGTLLALGAPGRPPSAADAAEARELLRRSTAAEPGRVDTWVALGTVEAMEGGDRKAAVRAFEKAWRLAPDRSDLLATFTMALAEDGQAPRAEALLRQTLLRSANPEDRITGEVYLQRIAEREVWGLANEGKLEESLARIAAYLAAKPTAELAKSLNETKGRIESQLHGQRCADDYNAGIRAANAQKFAEAKPFFEKVIAGCALTDLALVDSAKKVLGELAKFEKKKK